MNERQSTIILIVLMMIVVYGMAFQAGLWWITASGNIYSGIYLIPIIIITIELGYMLCYRKMKKTYVFYLGYLLPAVLSTIGFVTGLIIK